LHVKKWQAALFALSAVIVILIFLAIFVIPTGRIIVSRFPDQSDNEFIPVSPQFVQSNRGLQAALSCADYHYDILKRAPGYTQPTMGGCDMKISWFDFQMIKNEIPPSQYEAHIYWIEYDEKHYVIVTLHA
jgi:hypothetical protein